MLFSLGTVVQTPGTMVIPGNEIIEAVHRHSRGDWGDLSEDDWSANDMANSNKNPQRIHSSYMSRNGIRFWIITEWDRSVTTILLPEEY